jgi:hypothetical protein
MRGKKTKASIYNISGHKVLDVPGMESQGELMIPITGIQDGRYLLEVTGGGERIAQPFCLVR